MLFGDENPRTCRVLTANAFSFVSGDEETKRNQDIIYIFKIIDSESESERENEQCKCDNSIYINISMYVIHKHIANKTLLIKLINVANHTLIQTHTLTRTPTHVKRANRTEKGQNKNKIQ